MLSFKKFIAEDTVEVEEDLQSKLNSAINKMDISKHVSVFSKRHMTPRGLTKSAIEPSNPRQSGFRLSMSGK